MDNVQADLLKQILGELKALRSLMEGVAQGGSAMFIDRVHVGGAIIPSVEGLTETTLSKDKVA